MKLFCNLDKKTIVITESQSKKIEETLAYHGSKMNFEEFNLAYMGTGAGAQEYGEGIYLTFDKEKAYGYGGTIYTVSIPDENKANYIYYDQPIPSDLFSAIIDNIITDITTQYPEEYEDEQSVKYLKKELYDILNPSEGRYLMYNIHRYIDDPIVIPKILKKAGVTGFIYNDGKVDNVIMFSSRDIKILDKEVVNENKNYINEIKEKVKELLFEQYLLEASLDDIYTKYYSNIPQDEFWQIIKADPTYNEQKSQKMGKYGKWLLNLYKQGKLKKEDLYKASDYLSYFVKYYNKVTEKDINKISDLPSLYNVIKSFKEASENGEEIATSKSDEVRRIKDGAEKVYEDNQWLVVVPHTQEASCYYGKNTQWCTAATKGHNMFNQYNNEGPLFINIRKTDDKKFQFHFESNSFMDETDTPIRTPFAKTIGINNGLLQYYINRYGGKATIILTCNNLDLGNLFIKGEDPYYVYNDYDGYYHIVEVKGTQITRCKGLEYDDFTADNKIDYIGDGNFKLYNYQNEEWLIYNAKSGRTITLSGDADWINKFNNQYIFVLTVNDNHILIDNETLKPVFETTNLIETANRYLLNFGRIDNSRKLTHYDDNLVITNNYDEGKRCYISQLYNIKQQSYIIPPFKPYKIDRKIGNDGYEYLAFKHVQTVDNRIDYCTILPDGSLTQVYQTESIHNDNDLINESYLIEAELKDIYPKYYSDISEKEFWEIIKADPTYNEQSPQKMGKYGKWLLNQYRHGNLDMNNLSEVKNILDFFNRYNRQLEKKDITQYKNVDQVYEAVKNYMADPTQATSKSDEARKIKEIGAEKVYEDNDWLIIVPKTQEAAIYYGKGTKWCTAASSSDNMFESYNDQGRLYININKHTGDKYQFHFESNSFMDAEDKPIQGRIAKEIGLSRGAEQFYASLGEDQEYEISYHDHGNINPQGEEEIFNRDGWRMVYNQNMFDLSIYNDNENEGYIINFDGSIEDMNGHPIKDPLYKFLPVFIIERLKRRYSRNVFYDMVLANYDPNDERPHQYFLLGNNGAVFQYYSEENSGVLYRVDEQTYQFTIVIDAIRYDLRLEDEVSYNDNCLIFLDKYNKKLCYNVNTFTWEFNGSVDKLCEIDNDYAAAVKNGIGIIKIFKNNMTIEIPPYNNMPIYNLVLDYLYKLNLVFAEVKTEIPDDYQIAVYSVAKKQYVNDKLYDTYFPMPKYAALAMGYDVDYIEDIIDEYIILTKEEKDYLQSLYSKYGEIIYHCPDSSDQIIFANGNIITRRDFFKREKVYDFLMKVWNKQFEN